MFSHSTTKISNEQVNRVVTTILNKRQKTLREQQQTFLRRNTDENNKRNNYLVDKFTMKKRTNSSKENLPAPLPTKKTSLPIILDDDDDDDDFVSSRKRPKVVKPPPVNPIKECLEFIIRQIEDEDDTRCPICNEILSSLFTLDQRQQHVNQCLETSEINHIETKQQKSLLSYPKFAASTSNSTRKTTTTTTPIASAHFKCQICGASFHVKRTYLAHLKKCSTQNSVQLKHVINFAAKSVPATTAESHDEPPAATVTKKKTGVTIKNRIIKMEVPRTEDDEQQQLAIALSASIKTAAEPPNAFEILQMASKKSKTIDLLTSPLWNVSPEEKIRLTSRRLSSLCERLISMDMPSEPYLFARSALLQQSQSDFGLVEWWKITTTDPQDDEIPMTQLARILEDEESISN